MVEKISTVWLLLTLLAPLFGAIVSGGFGTLFGGHLIRRKTSQYVTTICVGFSLLASLIVLNQVSDGITYNETIYTWASLGALQVDIGFMIDGLSALMMCVVTFVSFAVHIYSMRYMENDDNVSRFFCYISLFTFSMLALVMSNNFVGLFFGWEAVGVMSYLLIGFWLDKESAVKAGLKAFVVNRIGDACFIIGVGILFAYSGSLHFQDIFDNSVSLSHFVLPNISFSIVTVACLFLFVGAMAKSAQFPLHVWLPDSMEGPTPISALIHAATMVTAGIFVVARLSPLYELSTVALTVMMIVGAITALFLGILAIVQTDIKRVVAFSTLSQLGYMVVGLGASAYAVSVFHLTTHACFKALLFLAVGSVILGMRHDQDITHMGGLYRYMPITYVMMLIGSLALIGTPFFSGFYSKESLLSVLWLSNQSMALVAYVVLALTIFVTALYTFRLFFYVFHGKERFLRQQLVNLKAQAQEKLPEGEFIGLLPGEKPMESSWLVHLPLALLAIPSIFIGMILLKPFAQSGWLVSSFYVDLIEHPAFDSWAEQLSNVWAMTLHGMISVPFVLTCLGVLLAWYAYVYKPSAPIRLRRRLKRTYLVFLNEYYIEAAYAKIVSFIQTLGLLLWRFIDQKLIDEIIIHRIIIGSAKRIGKSVFRIGDQIIIDGFLVRGGYRFVGWISSVTRHIQSGYLYHYVLVMLIGVIGLLVYFVPLTLK